MKEDLAEEKTPTPNPQFKLKEAEKRRLYNQVKLDLDRKKTVERFQQYSKFEAEKSLKEYTEQSKFWRTMSNALLAYDYVLSRDKVQLIMCDDFYEGVFVPSQDKIMLCANILMRKPDFDQALSRQLTFLYDHTRGQLKYGDKSGSSERVKGTYDLNKCKHLACSEVRAAVLSNKCRV